MSNREMVSETEWRAMTLMSIARRGAAHAAIDDNRFAVLGGTDERKIPLSSVEMCDRRTNKWTNLPNDMPGRSRHGCASASIDNKVYVMGGRGSDHGDTNSLFALDTATLEWETLPSMKRTRSYFAAVAVGRFICVFGGYRDKTAERYNVDTKKWEDLPSMSTERWKCAAVAVQNKIYVIGGKYVNKSLEIVEVFDVDTQKWESPSSVNDMSVARNECAAVVAEGGFVVVIGGHDGSKYLSSIEVLDTATGTWTESPHSMTTPRSGHGTVVLGDSNIYILGGYDGSNFLTSCESIPSICFVPYAEDVRSPPLLNDASYGEDLLGMKEAILAVATMLGLKDLIAPYVLAILGGWGSGKSFAFHSILKHLKEIQKVNLMHSYFKENDNDNPYCGHLYYVKFDAWTFAKGNLWASLMHQILVSLNDQLHLESLLREVDPELLMKGVSTIEIMEELTTGEFKYLKKLIGDEEKIKDFKEMDVKNNNITESLINATNVKYKEDYKKLQQKKKELEQKKNDFALKLTWDQLNSNTKILPEIKSLLERAYTEYKTKFKNSSDPVPQTVQDGIETFNFVERYCRLFWAGKWTNLWMTVIVVSTVLAVLVPFMIQRFDAFYACIAPALVSIATKINDAKAKLADAQDILSKAIDDADSAQLQSDNEDLEAQEGSIQKLRAEVKTLQDRVWLVEGDSIDQVVKDRIDSGDYEKQLGVVHQAQTDLKRLSDAMFSNVKHDKTKPLKDRIFPRGDPRIVLFIDDLDRCPPNKVMETLEAIQLLVKTDLFVVVIAIDARYVTLALEDAYAGILDADRHPSGLDYLEKIIQLGYRIPPIQTEEAMRDFIRAQIGKTTEELQEESAPETTQEAVRDEIRRSNLSRSREGDVGEGAEEAKNDYAGEDEEAQNTEDSQTESGGESANEPKEDEPNTTEKQTPSTNEGTPSKVYKIPGKTFSISNSEAEMLEEACLAADVSPRAGKRLVNVFKLMKLIWYLVEEDGITPPSDDRKKVFVLLLALSASTKKSIRLGMCKYFLLLSKKGVWA